MSKILKILTTECMIIQYTANQCVIRLPYAAQAQTWKAIQRNGYIIIGSDTIKSNELERLSMTEPLPRCNVQKPIVSIK